MAKYFSACQFDNSQSYMVELKHIKIHVAIGETSDNHLSLFFEARYILGLNLILLSKKTIYRLKW